MRLRQYLANRYASSAAVNAEFENIVRYINSAELGNLTLAELLGKIFDDDGELTLGIEFRYDATTGIEVKIDPDSDEWQLLVDAEDIRGAAGQNLGTVESPLFFNRVDATATSGQTVFPYTVVSEAADVLVWINGVLQASDAYTYSSVTDQVTLDVGATLGQLVTIVSIRTNPATAYRRQDFTAVASQVTFPFPHEESEEIIVFRNGIFQREGGGYDYVRSWETGVVTMTTGQTVGTVITIMCITNTGLNDVAGLMLEDYYTNGAGAIRYDRIAIADEQITQAKVSGLVAALLAKAPIYVQSGTPATPAAGSLWVNTSTAVPTLNFYDGVTWHNAAPNGMIPLPTVANALQYVRLNSTATALEFASIDLSSLIPNAQKGAASGVAPLDSSGLLPAGVIPTWAARAPIIGAINGVLANGTYNVGIIEDIHMVDSLCANLSAGSATLQLKIGGVNIGGTLAADATVKQLAITPVSIDASVTPKLIQIEISGVAGATNLSFNIGSVITG